MSLTALTKAGTNASAMSLWTITRSVEMHNCPAEEKHERMAPSTARLTEASAAT